MMIHWAMISYYIIIRLILNIFFKALYHKKLPNLVAKFWLPNLVLYHQTAKSTLNEHVNKNQHTYKSSSNEHWRNIDGNSLRQDQH